MTIFDDLQKAVDSMTVMGEIHPLKVTKEQFNQLKSDKRIIPYAIHDIDAHGSLRKFFGVPIQIVEDDRVKGE